MDYWNECISEALEDAGISATDEQIKTIAGWVEGAHDNYGMAFGHDAIPNPMISEVEQLKDEIRRLKDAHHHQLTGICKGVAKRRNVDTKDVSIDEHGHVTYVV